MKRAILLKRLALKVPRTTKLNIYVAFIRPVIEYASIIFDSCSDAMSDMLEKVQRQAALTITGAYNHTSHVHLLKELGLPLLSQRRQVSKIILIHKIITNHTPSYLKRLLPTMTDHSHETRQGNFTFELPVIRKNYLLKSFLPSSIRLWNKLDESLKVIDDIDVFRAKIKTLFIPIETYMPYLWGYTQEYIHLARLRMGLSGLNAHRKQYHFINNSSCPNCNFKIEDTAHYILNCPSYAAQRAEMIVSLQQLLPNVTQEAQSRLRRSQKILLQN